MSQQFTYTFTTIDAPTPETITLTVPDSAQLVYLGNETAYGYPVEAISGMFNGGTITGLVGAGMPGITGSSDDYYRYDPNDNHAYDNVVFINNQNGDAQTSYMGIDSDGLQFYEGGADYNLYTYSSHFQDYSTPQSAADPYYGTALQDTPVDNPATRVVLVTTDAPCFLPGTRIRTTRGDVLVENLRVGDLAVTVSGAARPIRWLGHRAIDCRTHPRPAAVRPVRIHVGAFGASLPARDLFLSPGHPVLVGADAEGEGGHLVPIMCLVNGTTIERVAFDEVTYWHVELDTHDILLAEGLPAESYIDGGDRAFFGEGSDQALHDPDFVVPGLAGRCRPVAVDGPVVTAELRRLDAVFASRLAMACAWPGGEAEHPSV